MERSMALYMKIFLLLYQKLYWFFHILAYKNKLYMLVFVGSNSSTSINKQLTLAVLNELKLEHEFIDLNALNIPLFSQDLEKEIESPEGIRILMNQIQKHSHIFITTNEHNQNLSAFFKNVLDWLSRSDVKFLSGKKIFILSTSEGRRGALGANESLQNLVTRFGCESFEWVTFPSFSINFDKKKQQILNRELLDEIYTKLIRIFKS